MKMERNRYLILRFISLKRISEKEAWFIVSSSVKKMFGIFGASNIGLFLSYYDESDQLGIFRVAHNAGHLVGASICFINSRNGQDLYVSLESTTGTIKKAKQLLKKYSERTAKMKNLLIKNLDDDTLHS